MAFQKNVLNDLGIEVWHSQFNQAQQKICSPWRHQLGRIVFL